MEQVMTPMLSSYHFENILETFIGNVKSNLKYDKDNYVFISSIGHALFKEDNNYYNTLGLTNLGLPEILVKGDGVLIRSFLYEMTKVLDDYIRDDDLEKLDLVEILNETLVDEKFDEYFDEPTVEILDRTTFLFEEGMELRMFYERESPELLEDLKVIEIKGFKNDSN